MAPIPNHPADADIDCSGREFPAKFALAADFDADLRAELGPGQSREGCGLALKQQRIDAGAFMT